MEQCNRVTLHESTGLLKKVWENGEYKTNLLPFEFYKSINLHKLFLNFMMTILQVKTSKWHCKNLILFYFAFTSFKTGLIDPKADPGLIFECIILTGVVLYCSGLQFKSFKTVLRPSPLSTTTMKGMSIVIILATF